MAIKKIPCGGFYVDDGAVQNVDGKPVLSVWNADLPKPSVGGYGYTEQGEQVIFDDNLLIDSPAEGVFYSVIDIDPLEVGETYNIVWNGVEYICECVGGEVTYIGNESIIGMPVETDEPFFVSVGEGDAVIVVTSTSGTYSIKVSKGGETVHKIDEKYLPENLATKSDVEATQEVLDGVFSSVATFTFDKQTSGRDTFVFNAFNYYKISDFNPALEDVISFHGTRESGDEYFNFAAGHNCVDYGLFIVVASAGRCSLRVSETTTHWFTAPSAGLYAMYDVNNPLMTAGTAEFTLKPSNENYIYIDGVFLKSSTTGSTKKFRITVDDSGTISATEVV